MTGSGSGMQGFDVEDGGNVRMHHELLVQHDERGSGMEFSMVQHQRQQY
jgi:hypothetical protein